MRRPVLALLISAAHRVAASNTLCNDGSYVSPDDDLIYVPNAWNADDVGFSCITVQNSPPTMDATWRWTSDRSQVHSYPHVQFTNPALPVPLSNISAITLVVQWSMRPASGKPRSIPGIDPSGLARLHVSANVAFDLFADRNAARAQRETAAETEIMIWLGTFGQPHPLGYSEDESRAKVTVGHVEFTLYQGTNQRGAAVFSWVAGSNETSFGAEISPLLQYLWRTGLVSAGSHLGLVGFGSEAYHAQGNVTFSMANYDMEVLVAPAPALSIGPIPSASSTTPVTPTTTAVSAVGHLGASWRLSAVPISVMTGAFQLLF